MQTKTDGNNNNNNKRRATDPGTSMWRKSYDRNTWTRQSSVAPSYDVDPRMLKLMLKISECVDVCIVSAKRYPEVSLYISRELVDAVAVRYPAPDNKLIPGYQRHDWHTLLEDGEPNFLAIHQLAEEYFPELIDRAEHPEADNSELTSALLEQLTANLADGRNLLISPLGVASLLEMIRLGTEGGSQANIAIARLLRGFTTVDLELDNTPSTCLEHATAMWVDRDCCPVKHTFKALLKSCFHTIPHKVDFALTDNARRHINAWTKKATHGKIPQLQVDISYRTLMLMANAIYFRSKWLIPFDPTLTRTATFHNADGTKSCVDMMHITDDFYHSVTDRYQLVELPYGDGDYTMTIMLPKRGEDLCDIVRRSEWLESSPDNYGEVELHLPRFDFNTKLNLADTLRALHLDDLFDSTDALTALTDKPAAISAIMQQCAVSVGEHGTEAAAVTFTDVIGASLPSERRKKRLIKADRPFAFAIRHCHGTIIFVGIVNRIESLAEPFEESERPDQTPIETPAKELGKPDKYITTITIAGTTHVDDIDLIASDICPGVALTLQRVHDNPHDHNAIEVYLGNHRIGYIPKARNEILARLLDAGIPLRATIATATYRGSWLRITAHLHL